MRTPAVRCAIALAIVLQAGGSAAGDSPGAVSVPSRPATLKLKVENAQAEKPDPEKTERPPDAKPPEKAAEKPPDAKPPEAKAPETKPPDAKLPEAKPPETKAAKAEKAPVGSSILTIKLAFMSDARLFPYDINVDMKGETVELSGKVPSDAEKQAAADVAQRIEGVKSIKNELEVAKDIASATAKKRDEMITHYVKERFSKSKTLDSANFDVKTEDGVVSLSGKTRFQVIALEAAEAARAVPGVKAVRTDGIQLEAS